MKVLAVFDEKNYTEDMPEFERYCVRGVTHEMAFARDVSTRTIFMDSGYVAEDAAPSELFTNPKNPRTKEFLKRYLAG